MSDMAGHEHRWGEWRANRPVRHPINGRWYVQFLRDCASAWCDPPCEKGHEMLTAEVSQDWARELQREYDAYTKSILST